MNRLMIVVPCFNEQEVLPLTIPALTKVVEGMILSGKRAAGESKSRPRYFVDKFLNHDDE